MKEPTKLNLDDIRNCWIVNPRDVDARHFVSFMNQELKKKDFVCPAVLNEQSWIEHKVESLLWKAISKVHNSPNPDSEWHLNKA
jgi:hypothetical protein